MGSTRLAAREFDLHIALFATEWATSKGGISAFNLSFATALAQVGGNEIRVTCAVQKPTAAAIRLAAKLGVQLVNVDSVEREHGTDAAREVLEASSSRDQGGSVDIWIGHDVTTGFAAVEAAEAFGGVAVLIHHMNFESYKNLSGAKGDRTIRKHTDQIELFSSPGVVAFGVGSDLAESACRLGNTSAKVIVPGFPAKFEGNSAGDQALHAMMAGRFDRTGEPLKQSELAARALGQAIGRSGRSLRVLERATFSVFGASRATATRADLERIVQQEAQQFVAVNPTRFTSSTESLILNLTRSNLAFMPSVREGFGLAGWEAIGCEVPLILGRQTGLYAFLDRTLEGQAHRYVHPIHLTGLQHDVRDVEAMADCIVAIAEDLPLYRERAKDLRAVLKEKLSGCTWEAAAQRFLTDIRIAAGASTTPQIRRASLGPSFGQSNRLHGEWQTINHKPDCSHLRLPRTMNQADTSDCFDVQPTLQFGTTDLAVDAHDVEVQIGLRRAVVRVTSETGWTGDGRLGDQYSPSPGITAQSGDRWEITDPDGGLLGNEVLRGVALCRIESPSNTHAHARIEVTTRKRDISYDFVPATTVDVVTQKVMKAFLDGALFKEDSGHLILSESEMRESR